MKRFSEIIKAGTAMAVAAGVMALGSTAHADIFTGTIDQTFETAGNWDTVTAPISGATSTINNGSTVIRDVNSTTGRLFIEAGSTMNITTGTHSDNLSGAGTRNFLGRGSTATINQSGGSYDIGHMLSIGGGGASGNGTYNLTGGVLNLSRGANSIIDGANPNGRPSLEVGDEEAAGSALLEISGGELVTRFAAGVGPNGVFSVVGSDATSINIGNLSNGGGDWVQKTGGTLRSAIDVGGITTINVNDLNGALDVVTEFEAGSFLDLGFESGVTPFSGTWTLLEAEATDILDSGLGLSGGTAAGWSFAVDNSGANGLLTATFNAVPEPSSLAVLGLGGLALIGRRRK